MDKMQTIVLLLLVALLSDSSEAQARYVKCIENHKCVPLSQCTTDNDGGIIYPCNENQTYVCCLSEKVINASNSTSIVLRTSAFPNVCGIVSSADRITGGEIASIGQFPWMALLGYRQEGVEFVQFLCGGSIITQEYILTAAHCISIHPRLKIFLVRLGELNLETEKDCETSGVGTETCADPYVDIRVDSVKSHENYNNKTLESDIALIKLKKKITFTDFVQPICLPFQNDIKYKTIVNNKLTVSGWGKTDSANVAGSSTLQYAQVTVWDQVRCNISIPPRIRPVRETQLCANGAKKQDACKGDSGGPLVNTTLIDADIRSYQIGIVSFSSTQICGNAELPTIYTRVDSYLNWIVSNVVSTS